MPSGDEHPTPSPDGVDDDWVGAALRQISTVTATFSSVTGPITGGLDAIRKMMAFLDWLYGKDNTDPLTVISQQLAHIADLIERSTKGIVLADVRDNQRMLAEVRSMCASAVNLCRNSPHLNPSDPYEFKLYRPLTVGPPPTSSQLDMANDLSFRAVDLLSDLDGVLWTRMRHPMFLDRPAELGYKADLEPLASYDGSSLVWDHRWALGTLLYAVAARAAVLVALDSTQSPQQLATEREHMAATVRGVRDRMINQIHCHPPMKGHLAVLGGNTSLEYAWHEGTGTIAGAYWSPYYSTFNYPTTFEWIGSTPGDSLSTFPDGRQWSNWLTDSTDYRRIHYAFSRLTTMRLASQLALFDLDATWYAMDRAANPTSTTTLSSGILSSAEMPPDWGL